MKYFRKVVIAMLLLASFAVAKDKDKTPIVYDRVGKLVYKQVNHDSYASFNGESVYCDFSGNSTNCGSGSGNISMVILDPADHKFIGVVGAGEKMLMRDQIAPGHCDPLADLKMSLVTNESAWIKITDEYGDHYELEFNYRLMWAQESIWDISFHGVPAKSLFTDMGNGTIIPVYCIPCSLATIHIADRKSKQKEACYIK